MASITDPTETVLIEAAQRWNTKALGEPLPTQEHFHSRKPAKFGDGRSRSQLIFAKLASTNPPKQSPRNPHKTPAQATRDQLELAEGFSETKSPGQRGSPNLVGGACARFQEKL